MGGKKRKSSVSGPVDEEHEADDSGYNARLARRWKRRCIANKGFKLKYSGKNSSNEGGGKCNKAPIEIPEINCVRIDVDVDDNDVDSDYRVYLDSLDLEAADDSDADNYRKVGNGVDTGGDIVVEDTVMNDDTHHNDANPQHESENAIIETNKEEDYVDPDYEQYFLLEALDENNIGKCSSLVSSDPRSDMVVGNMLADDDACDNVVFNDADPQSESIHEGDNIRINDNKEEEFDDYEKPLAFDCFGLDVNDFVNTSSDVNAVNGYVENDSGGDKLVENTSANDYIDNDNNISASGYMDLQTKEIPQSNKNDTSNNEIDVDNAKFVHVSALGLSGDTAVNGSITDGSGVDELMENEHANNHIDNNNSNVNALGDTDLQNKKMDVDNEQFIDDSALGPLGDNDWSADNIAVDHSGANQSTKDVAIPGGFVETRSMDNDADHNDDLDDLQYEMFLKNLREEGKSYVLEVPVSDGISEIIKYEIDDGSRDLCSSENPKRTRRTREAPDWTKHDFKPEMECDMLDDCYKFFLNSLKKEGRHWVFTPENGVKLVYDEDEESSSDSEVIVMDSDPFADEDYTPFVTSKYAMLEEHDGNQWINGSSRNDQSWFREGVTEILRKPYDQKEYNQLLSEVRCRKMVKDERDMRNGRTRQCPGRKLGNSYLDLHQDLARKINSVGSKPKVLNLLRGFFYWLKNVAHDGVFKPWNDSSCLKILPS